MRLATTNRFQKFEFTAEELVEATKVSPLFFAYLQTKIAEYADAVVEHTYKPTEPEKTAIIKHERLKAQVEILEELMSELTPPSEYVSTAG